MTLFLLVGCLKGAFVAQVLLGRACKTAADIFSVRLVAVTSATHEHLIAATLT